MVGLGDGHFVNYGVATRNECMMKIWAHAHPIISIVSLGGYLKNKYFATRCSDGHVSIWSSTNKPEKIFILEHMDSDKDKLQHLQPPKEEEVVEVVVKKKKGDGDDDDDGDDDAPAEEEPPAEDEEEAKKKKKVVNEPPQVQPLIGRLEPSERDTMIEIKWKGLINQSSTMLAVSNFINQKILICNVDIKTRSREIKKEIPTESSPTCMFQINEDYLLVGTMTGRLELRSIDTTDLKRTIDAHPGSVHGITVIMPLVDPSELITNERASDSQDCNYIVTAVGDQKAFKIWRIMRSNGDIDLHMHIKIETTLANGIHFMLQTDAAQLVCCDNTNVLKFYDFVDKLALKEKEENDKDIKKFSELVSAAFREADGDNSGYLDIEEVKPMCLSLIKKFGGSVLPSEEAVVLEKMFAWLDSDGSGRVSFHEFKVQMMRSYIKKALPEELLQ